MWEISGNKVHFKCIIDICDSDEITSRDECEDSDFIQAALNAAKHSKAPTRTQILHDVSDVLGCNVNDLEFLFQKETHIQAHNIYQIDLPNSRFEGDNLKDNETYLQAAE